MDLLATTLKSELKELNENNVKMNFIGDLKALNQNLQDILAESKRVTKDNTGVVLTVAINYGSRDEIVSAVKNIIKDNKKEEEITPDLISKYLYTSGIPDPDLLIRTGGEMRVSNYLLWQIAYSEILVVKEFWPEFGRDNLMNAVEEFQRRQRRFGK